MRNHWPTALKVKGFTTLFGLLLLAMPLFHTGLAYASTQACAANAQNLVYNPGFEGVNGPSGVPYDIYGNSSGVTYWTTFPTSHIRVVPSPNGFNNNNASMVWPPYEGYNQAVLSSFVLSGGLTAGAQQFGYPGLVGTLSTPTTPGTTYVLSARVSNELDNYVIHYLPVAIEIRLHNSTTNAESAAVQAIVPNNNTTDADGNYTFGHQWGLVTGAVTANGVYDKVIIRHYQNNGWAFIDDVHVCKAAAGGTTTSIRKTRGMQAGLVLITMAVIGGFIVWGTRRSNTGTTSRSSDVAVSDINGDGRLDSFKVAENESPRPNDRVFLPTNKVALSFVVLVISAATIYIATAGGGVWKSKDSTTTKTNTVLAKSCNEKENLQTGYSLFRSETYKYCIQYPKDWSVNSTKADVITFGTFHQEPAPGWLRVTYFSDKSTATRSEELMSNYREPAGPCKTSDLMIGAETAKKLDCIGAFNGEDHIYYLITEDKSLVELSYIEGMDTDKAAFDIQYKVVVDSFLLDSFANKQ